MNANRARGDEELRRIVEGLAASVAAINERLPPLAVREELVISDPTDDDAGDIDAGDDSADDADKLHVPSGGTPPRG